MKKVNAWEESITINDKFYTVTIVEIESTTYDAYIDNGKEPMRFMFGLLVLQQSAEEAMDIAIANAPDYIGDFED